MKKQYTQDEIQDIKMEAYIAGAEETKAKYATILNYILNKNSHPMPREVDYEKLFADLQDLEHYLYMTS